MTTQLTTIHSHTKRRLHQLKSTTKAMFKQNDDDNEIMNDRIFRLEESLAKLKPDIGTPRLNRKPNYPTQNTTPSHTRSATNNRFHVKTIPDMDYLRKNLHLIL